MAGGQWWVVWNANSGAIKVVQSVTKPATPASGKVYGPYATQAAAKVEADPNTSTLGVIGLGVSAGAGVATGGAAGDVQAGGPSSWEKALEAIAQVFTRLASANLWERVGEVMLGLLLIQAGVAHLTHAVPFIEKAAGTVAGAAIKAP